MDRLRKKERRKSRQKEERKKDVLSEKKNYYLIEYPSDFIRLVNVGRIFTKKKSPTLLPAKEEVGLFKRSDRDGPASVFSRGWEKSIMNKNAYKDR